MRNKFKKVLRAFSAVAMALSIVFLSANPSMVFAASSASTSSATKPSYGIVSTSGSNLNVRQSPVPASTILGSLANGSYIMIIGEYGDYYKVVYDKNGNVGYVASDYVTFVSTSFYLWVNDISGNLNLRASASTSSTSLALLPAKTPLAYVSTTTTGWYRGVYGNLCGYVSTDYVQRYSW